MSAETMEAAESLAESAASAGETAQAAAEAAESATEAATEAAEAAESAAEVVAETATEPPVDPVPQSYLPVSELAGLEAQNELLRDNLELMFRRIDQLTRLQESSYRMLTSAAQLLNETGAEMRTTMELAQEMISAQDERIEALATVSAALAKISNRLLRKRRKTSETESE